MNNFGPTVFTNFLATVFVVAHWSDSWVNVQNFRTAYPFCLFVRRLHMGDNLLLCFGYCCVNCGGKAFFKIMLQLAVGHSVELTIVIILSDYTELV